jgi:hypothetical protein
VGTGRPSNDGTKNGKEENHDQVDYHDGRNRTLKERIEPSVTFKDCASPMWCNSNAAEFYRAVAKRIAERAKKYDVAYQDTSLD